MHKDEQAIEAAIAEKGLTAPRVTPEMVDAFMAGEKVREVPDDHKKLLLWQRSAMDHYLGALRARLEAFADDAE
jgi:hypothetical protein